MAFSFGERSRANLATVDSRLAKVVETALATGIMDFSVIEGHRSLERQKELYAAGKTKANGVTTFSNHNHFPSLAVDLLPYPPKVNGLDVWSDRPRFAFLAGIMFACAYKVLGTEKMLRWGGDWDGDGNNHDSSFLDMPHFELVLSN